VGNDIIISVVSRVFLFDGRYHFR